ncbi:MFS general substrate transporter [Catenaria anguillulae PL171]|uniref:MFS general substrate transporter n=1 Tax=Catenaria anguillulae PL171 TaxID=765915 RepID=A0A1Y2HQZ6_9FUNG|nr:MFS general substrate transporter [Catenaria anguillulae PL171]
MLQGVPVGLAFGTLPFLLKQKLSYTDMAVFSLAGYPYSLKLLWSPIVDSVFFKSIGRRKSWIIPIQLFTGLTFYWLSRNVDAMFAAESINVYLITAMWFFVIFLCATQDIAVDGWALTLLSRENMQFASTCQTVGINIGYFMSFTIFLAFNSAEFCNKYIRSVPSDLGLLQLGPYLGFWALFYIGLTLWVAFFKDEGVDPDEHDVTIKSTYLTIMDIIKLPHMLKFIAVLLLAKVAFICNESVTALKLLEKGIQKEDLALAVLIDFPFQILFGYLAAQWSSGARPLRPWLYGFIGRLAISLVGMLVVSAFPTDGTISRAYFGLVIATTVLGSFTSTVQFVSMGAFFSTVADPLIGGTYMTLLNTVSNLGGTFPKAFVLEAVDYFTTATCVETGLDCVSAAGKLACTKAGGTCLIERDGYYWVGSASFVLGLLLLWRLIRPEVRLLESLPLRMWKVKKGGSA